ncbi:histidine kinase dimerization/phospho-acceptor domain-containing protein [Limnohabitans sp. Rim8]|uniref:histidine kinase dimerization/phospho-acceptor domain-containing protein n=1 Tax=Limnohabitans sp. Rim8 TaxID=1100718 RepID=UPI002612E6D7|nr:histidine kinase dimerization/phospho-acceptor domain-containing protein [Limnohabitans sp. Rim8]
MQPRSLWRYLWAWALGAVVALWLLLAGLSYSTGHLEAEEISDGLLVSTAQMLLAQPWPDSALEPDGKTSFSAPEPKTTALPAALHGHSDKAYVPDLHVLMWQDDRLVWDSHGMQAQWPTIQTLGHQTLHLTVPGQTQEWRVYVAESKAGSVPPSANAQADRQVVRRVAVFLDPARREALAADIAEHILLPALLFLPLVALILASAMRRGLLPLKRLSSKISALDVDAGQTLMPQQPFQELGVTVQAINHLVQRLQEEIARERRFAADVAHELRTPLTALVLQSRLARDAALPSEQAQALQAVEQGALQAGRILSQLLDLARAQSLGEAQSESVDLCALAQGVVAEHVALAHALGQDIALEAPAHPVTVSGQSTLLALALRNLVDNALRHNPSGTYVEVRIARDGQGLVRLSVSDDGSDMTSEVISEVISDGAVVGPQDSAPMTGHAPQAGLGIGLTLVERIAQSQGAQFIRDTGTAPFGKRFALVWPAVTHRTDGT